MRDGELGVSRSCRDLDVVVLEDGVLLKQIQLSFEAIDGAGTELGEVHLPGAFDRVKVLHEEPIPLRDSYWDDFSLLHSLIQPHELKLLQGKHV